MKKLLWILAFTGIVMASRAADEKIERQPDLTGRVANEAGKPVPKATVFIYTAGPKTGTASLCPSCYADCRKKARTGPDGRFKIESLDPRLLFRLLVVAGGHEATFVPKVDPASGPAEITLKALDEAALKSKTRIAGVVLDPAGQPLVGAVLDVNGVDQASFTLWGNSTNVVDPLAVADDQGRFVLRCTDEVKAVHAIAEGRGVAKRWVKLIPGRDHLIRMQEGVTITGRIVRQNRPLKDVVIGLITTKRRSGVCLHDFETATDRDGKFVLLNVTPENEYYLFAKMASLGGQGALRVKTVKSGADGGTLELGELAVWPAYRVAGRIVLSDGKTVPPNTRLLMGRDQAWDHTDALLDAEGRFEVKGVPAESVSLSVRIPGYRFSRRNPSLDWLNGGIVGRVERDMDDLVLLMEPGERRSSRDKDQDMPARADRQPRDKPLRGVSLDKAGDSDK